LWGKRVREIRIFVSSPSDAHFERRRLERVVERLNGELRGSILLRAIRWETAFYSAHETFQTQIPPATECDIVVGILRHRLGTELPPDFPRMPDGTPYPSGTAYEVLTAIEARRTKELPDVYVFRYAEPPTVALDDPETQAHVEEQWERLKGFFGEWFVSSEGQFKAAFHTFDSTDQFEEQIESLLRQWIEEHVLSDRSISWPIEIKGSPFRGLDAFDTKHAAVFFGRSRDTARAVDALKEAAEDGTPYLLVVGPSGAGKSSLARAGLVPRLTAAGVVPSVDLWRVAVFRPAERASDPFVALAEQLLTAQRGGAFDDSELTALPELAQHELATPRQLANHLMNSDAPADAIIAALDDSAKAERLAGGYDRPVAASLLVVADQLDELFAGDISEETRSRFGAMLAGLVKTGRVWVIATLRADLYERYVTVAPLLALKTDGAAYDLAPPGPAELAEIVRRPAEAANLAYEADADGRTLDERLIADAERADMLPLLQFTLNRLFEERIVVDGDTRLTQAASDAIGGLSGAIDQEAERALAPLKERVIARLPRLLRDLATPAKRGEGEGGSEAMRLTIRSVPLSRAAHDAEARELVQALVDARILLSSGGDAESTIRIAHQRVLESWGRARDIVAENAEFFRIRQEVEDERRRWEEGGRRRDRLIRPGVPLAEAESISQRFRDELPAETRTFIQASGNRARLRQRLTAAAALVFLGVAIAAAYLGWRASVAEEEAQRNYLTARNTIDTIVFDVAQGLRDVEGVRIESIRTILQEVEKAVDELAQSMPNEAGLYRSRATMLMLFGDVYLAAGDTRMALQNYEEALMASRVLAAEFPDDRNAERDVLVDLVRVADAKQRIGDVTGAAADFNEALSIGRALVEAEPDNSLWRRDLSMVLQRFADMRARTGDTAAAQASAEESLAAARRAAELEPDNADAQEDIAVVLERIGDLQLRSGDLAEATATYQQSLDLRRELSAEEPGNTERQRAVVASLSKIGDAKLLAGDRQAALADFEEALAIARRQAELDEENVQALNDISVLAGKVGDASLRGGDFERALVSFEESLDIDKRLSALEPDNSEWQRDVSVSLNRIGNPKLRTGDVEGALEAYRESLEVMRRTAAIDPENIGWQATSMSASTRWPMRNSVSGICRSRLKPIKRRLPAPAILQRVSRAIRNGRPTSRSAWSGSAMRGS
jgi:tetratricopeptide (TPR) repeat protein